METRTGVAEQLKRERGRTALAAARLGYRRGQLEEAFRQTREVLLLDEALAEAHELMGDILREQGKPDAALEEFRRALELDPQLGSAEEKIGLISIERDNIIRFDQRRTLLASDATKRQLEERKPALAAVLSSVIPGGGQYYNEDEPRAILLFCVAVATLFFWMYPTINTYLEVKQNLTVRATTVVGPNGRAVSTTRAPRPQIPTFSQLVEGLQSKGVLYCGWIVLNILLCTGAWGYSIGEATTTARRQNHWLRKQLGIE